MPGKDDMVLNLQAIVTANIIGAGLMIMLLISNRTSSRHLFFDEKLFYFMAVMTFLLLFYENSGIVRAYIIACVFFGMIFYDKIISRNVFQLLKKLKKWYKIKRKTASEKRRNRHSEM